VAHPIQHFAPAFRLLASSDVIDFQVVYGRSHEGGYFDREFGRDVSWDVDLTSGYGWTSIQERTRKAVPVRAMMDLMGERRPHLVLPFGWGSGIARAAIMAACIKRVPFALYGDSTYQHPNVDHRGLSQRAALNTVIRTAAGALSTGAFNRYFYLTRGMPSTSIIDSGYPVDLDLYEAASAAGTKTEAPRFRIGFAGKLIARKGAQELLAAAALLGSRVDWELLLIGDGPLRGELEALARALGIDDRTSFVGFQNQRSMPPLLATLDVLVVPSSRDFRTLIVAEGMAAGVPVIASSNTAVWGHDDILEHGVSGLVYPSGNPLSLAASIRRLEADPARRKSLQTEASLRVKSLAPSSFAASVEEAALRWGRVTTSA
jgi:glycosyltransferase involved in cell wall biosynthesis